MESNYKMYQALQLGGAPSSSAQAPQPQVGSSSIEALGSAAAAMDTSDVDDDDDDADEAGPSGSAAPMAVDTNTVAALPSRPGRNKASPEFKVLVMKVLTDSGFELSRSAKMTQYEFIRLLADFHAAGIHFS